MMSAKSVSALAGTEQVVPEANVRSGFHFAYDAAMIESDRNNYSFEYVGAMDLAKNYGVRILYRLVSGG